MDRFEQSHNKEETTEEKAARLMDPNNPKNAKYNKSPEERVKDFINNPEEIIQEFCYGRLPEDQIIDIILHKNDASFKDMLLEEIEDMLRGLTMRNPDYISITDDSEIDAIEKEMVDSLRNLQERVRKIIL